MAADFTPKYTNMVSIHLESVQRFADLPLFGTKVAGHWEWMSFGEYGRRVAQLRAALHEAGVRAGDRVAMIANNRPEWAIAAYATYSMGAVYVPMYEAQLDRDWQFILKDCGAKVLFVCNISTRDRISSFRSALPALQHMVLLEGEGDNQSVTYRDLLSRAKDKAVEPVIPDATDTVSIIYTSGTTGNPKGVVLSHGNLASQVEVVQKLFQLGPEDRCLSFLPWAHSFGQTCELHSLPTMGMSIAIAESVTTIAPNMMEVRPTVLCSVPKVFNKIYAAIHKKMEDEGGLKKTLFQAALQSAADQKERAEQGRSSLLGGIKHAALDRIVLSKIRERFGGRMKFAVIGGAAVAPEIAEFVESLGIKLYVGYGLTETSPVISANYPGNQKLGSVGKPVPGVRVHIDIEATEDPGHGEIIAYGHNIMKGYFGLEEETKKIMTPDGGLRTGDMGYLDRDGYLFISGRIKEQYKLENGKYVVPTPVEEQFKLSPMITDIMLYGDNRPYNVAIITPEMDSLRQWARDEDVDLSDPEHWTRDERVRALFAEQLEEHSTGLKGYEKVRDFVVVADEFTTENGMLTPSLKIKRRKVLEKYGDQLKALYQ